MTLMFYKSCRRFYAHNQGFVTRKTLKAHLAAGGTIKVTCSGTRLDITDLVVRSL